MSVHHAHHGMSVWSSTSSRSLRVPSERVLSCCLTLTSFFLKNKKKGKGPIERVPYEMYLLASDPTPFKQEVLFSVDLSNKRPIRRYRAD